MKCLATLALAAPLAACGGAGDEPVASQTAEANPLGVLALPVFVEVDGVPRSKVGTMALREAADGGKIVLQLPGMLGRCSGVYRDQATPERAAFTISCADGSGAQGEFERTGPKRGFGTLRDDRGRRIAFSFGRP